MTITSKYNVLKNAEIFFQSSSFGNRVLDVLVCLRARVLDVLGPLRACVLCVFLCLRACVLTSLYFYLINSLAIKK